MTTQTITHNPVRSDVSPPADPAAPETRPSTRWALAGIGAGLAGVGVIVSTSLVSAVYDADLAGDTEAIADKLTEQVPAMVAFHFFGLISAVLMVVFAAGLYRRLAATASATSIAPMVAFAGLLGTAVVLVMGSGLDTEFIFTFAFDDDVAADPANAALYNHWLGTIPWVWVLSGLAGLAVYVVSRAGGVPRWIGRVGLVIGGLTLLMGMSPLQYMAGAFGPIWLLVTAIGFLVGDKAHRGRA